MPDILPRPDASSDPPGLAVAAAWPFVLVLAVGLDAVWPLPGLWGWQLPWLAIAALGCFAWALLARARTETHEAWATPFDGRILAAVAVAILQAIPVRATDPPVQWLWQMLACGLCFYALVARFRRDPLVAERLWRAFAAASVLLGVHALWALARGVPALVRQGAWADAHWAAQHGLPKALWLATLLTVGRAAERGAATAWRAAAAIGALGIAAYAFAGGTGLATHALARLDEPLYFSSTAVLLLLLAGLATAAWGLRRSRAREAPRWTALAAGFALLGLFTLFGGTSGGEGVRVLAALGAAVAVASREAPEAVAAKPAEAPVATPAEARAA